jgi:hypothetical protein
MRGRRRRSGEAEAGWAAQPQVTAVTSGSRPPRCWCCRRRTRRRLAAGGAAADRRGRRHGLETVGAGWESFWMFFSIEPCAHLSSVPTRRCGG